MAKTLEEWQLVLKQLEGVLKTSKDEEQRLRVFQQIKGTKKEIIRLSNDNADTTLPPLGPDEIEYKDDQEPANSKTEAEIEKTYQIIHHLNIIPLHPLSLNEDINFIGTAMQEFENEYWGVLSDYHLNLDYANSNKRDAFLTKLENNKRGIREYIKILDEMAHTNRDDFKKQLLSMASKQERSVIMEATEFFHELMDFLEALSLDHENHGNIIMNPLDVLEFDKLYGEKKLNKKTVIEGVNQTLIFVQEILDFVNLPNIYKKRSR